MRCANTGTMLKEDDENRAALEKLENYRRNVARVCSKHGRDLDLPKKLQGKGMRLRASAALWEEKGLDPAVRVKWLGRRKEGRMNSL